MHFKDVSSIVSDSTNDSNASVSDWSMPNALSFCRFGNLYLYEKRMPNEYSEQ